MPPVSSELKNHRAGYVLGFWITPILLVFGYFFASLVSLDTTIRSNAAKGEMAILVVSHIILAISIRRKWLSELPRFALLSGAPMLGGFVAGDVIWMSIGKRTFGETMTQISFRYLFGVVLLLAYLVYKSRSANHDGIEDE